MPDAAGYLTPRDQTVLGLVSEGLSNAEIAGRIGIEEQTVKNWLLVIYRRLEVQDRTSAVIRAAQIGEIEIEGLRRDSFGPELDFIEQRISAIRDELAAVRGAA